MRQKQQPLRMTDVFTNPIVAFSAFGISLGLSLSAVSLGVQIIAALVGIVVAVFTGLKKYEEWRDLRADRLRDRELLMDLATRFNEVMEQPLDREDIESVVSEVLPINSKDTKP